MSLSRSLTVAVLTLAVVASACSKGEAENPEAPAASPAGEPTASPGPAANATPDPAPDAASPPSEAPPADAPPRTDYITAAQGAWLVSINYKSAERGPSRYVAFQTYDGLTTPRGMVTGADPDAELELVYELPALTTFDRLAIPEVAEVPSPGTTFFREVEVHGSASSAEGAWQPLASATLETHKRRGQVTELAVEVEVPVRFLKLVLRGGIENLQEKMGYQFSELIGNGTQDTVPLEDGFTGIWDTRLPDVDRSAGLIELKQDGVAVTGCYHRSDITGTVSGNILRAQGVGRDDGRPSQFVVLIDGKGALRGTANANNGPFGLFGGPEAPEGSVTDCSDIPPPELGCGSIVYVQFEFDSAALRPESAPILSDLFEGLSAGEGSIVIEGHTSSEGSTEYNQELSERRAQSVVDDLVRRGLDPGRISAQGRGELAPIATNKDEAGRSLNRRVEVVCQ